jgi:hypothetical protein
VTPYKKRRRRKKERKKEKKIKNLDYTRVNVQ